MDRQYSSRPPSATSMDAPRDDPRPYQDRFTLPPLEYAPPQNNIKYPPSSPIVTLPSLHNQHNQHAYHPYPPQDRQPPMQPQEQSLKFSPIQPGTDSPFQFGRQLPESRQVRKIGQRRDTTEEYRKFLHSSNSSQVDSGSTNRPPPPPPQHQQNRPLSQQSSPTFGPPGPMQDPYHIHSDVNNHIISQNDPNSYNNVRLLRSPSPQSRDLRKRPSTGALPKPKEQKLRDSSGIGIADLIRPDSSKYVSPFMLDSMV